MRNCVFGLEFVTARKAGCIFGFFIYYVIEHSVARHDALCCRSKYSVGRQSTLSNRGNTLSAVTMLYDVEASTLSPVRVLNPAEVSTLMRVRVFSPIAETLCRPSRCSMLQEQVLCRATEYSIHLRKHSVGRQSTSANRASIVSAVRVLYAINANSM